MAINVVTLWTSSVQYLKAGTSGYFNKSEWENVVESVQLDLVEILTPHYENNIIVQDALGPFVKSVPTPYTVNGLTKPADYLHLMSLNAAGKPVYPIKVNEIGLINESHIRSPDATKGRYYYYMMDDKINLLPNTAVALTGAYIRKPLTAVIVLTPTSTSERDYLVPTVGVNLEWPLTMFNIILYMVLDKLGVQMKEQIVREFANMGIQRETQIINS